MPMLSPRAYHTSTVVGDRLVVAGGNDETGPLASIESAVIDSDGSLGAFVDGSLSSNVTTPMLATTAFAAGSFYALGGETDVNAAVTSVERASVSDDGSTATGFAVVATSASTLRWS